MSIHVLQVDQSNSGLRLDVFLAQNMAQATSRSVVKKLIEFGHVKVNEVLEKANHKIKTGDDVFVDIPEDFLKPQYVKPEDIPLDIFYQDQWLLVINKPSGMIVHPASGNYSGTLANALKFNCIKLSDINSDLRPGIVHRLDKGTSGLLLVAKDNITHAKLAKQFARREVKKRYIALVEGNIEFDEGMIDAPIGRHPHHREKKAVQIGLESGKNAVTYYQVIKRAGNSTLVALYPKTGRTHQLRVHMRHLRHPILGDDKYGKKNSFSRLALHAQAISFKHPATKSYVEFVLPPPNDFLMEWERGLKKN